MSLSKKQLQQKREKKKKKRQIKTRRPPLSTSAYNHNHWPIYACYIPSHLWEIGVGQVIVARKNDRDNLAVGIYLIDVFCLGIRDCAVSVTNNIAYEEILQGFNTVYKGLKRVEPSYAYTLICQAEAFAKRLGFKPHPDFSKAKLFLNNIVLDEDLRFTFGKEGKPHYLQGPDDSPADAQNVLQTLEKNLGRDQDAFSFELS